MTRYRTSLPGMHGTIWRAGGWQPVLLGLALCLALPAAAQQVRLATGGRSVATIYTAGPLENPELTRAQLGALTPAEYPTPCGVR